MVESLHVIVITLNHIQFKMFESQVPKTTQVSCRESLTLKFTQEAKVLMLLHSHINTMVYTLTK